MTDALPAIGVDLGGTNVRAAVVDTRGEVLASARTKVGDDHRPTQVIARTVEVVRRALSAAGGAIERSAGVGVGVAGQVRGESGVVAQAPNLGWRDVPFGEMLAEALGSAVRVYNDVEAITWGECRHGAARSHRHVLAVFAGTGVGGGAVVGGRLLRGATGVAVEIGHVKVADGGPACGCGGRGCLEAFVGGANLSRRLRERAREDWPALLQAADGDSARIHPGLVEQLLRQGDQHAADLFRELAGHLGTVLANAVTLLNPSALVLGGTVLEGCPTLEAWTREVFDRHVLAVAGEAVAILPAALGGDAGIIGAAALARQPDA